MQVGSARGSFHFEDYKIRLFIDGALVRGQPNWLSSRHITDAVKPEAVILSVGAQVENFVMDDVYKAVRPGSIALPSQRVACGIFPTASFGSGSAKIEGFSQDVRTYAFVLPVASSSTVAADTEGNLPGGGKVCVRREVPLRPQKFHLHLQACLSAATRAVRRNAGSLIDQTGVVHTGLDSVSPSSSSERLLSRHFQSSCSHSCTRALVENFLVHGDQGHRGNGAAS